MTSSVVLVHGLFGHPTRTWMQTSTQALLEEPASTNEAASIEPAWLTTAYRNWTSVGIWRRSTIFLLLCIGILFCGLWTISKLYFLSVAFAICILIISLRSASRQTRTISGGIKGERKNVESDAYAQTGSPT